MCQTGGKLGGNVAYEWPCMGPSINDIQSENGDITAHQNRLE